MRAVFALLIAAFLPGLPSAAQTGAGIGAFAGDWRGGSIDLVAPNPLGDSLRDLEIKIVVKNDGSFIATSLAQTRRSDVKRMRTLEFRPSKSGSFWQAQLSCDPAGAIGCAWARLDRNRLVITSIDVDESGAIETQVTERTVDGAAMRIHFLSFVEGKPRRELRGSLQRVQRR